MKSINTMLNQFCSRTLNIARPFTITCLLIWGLSGCGVEPIANSSSSSSSLSSGQSQKEVCDLPNNLSWTSSDPIVTPNNQFVAVKEPSVVFYQEKYYLFATAQNTEWWSIFHSFESFDTVGEKSYQLFAPGGIRAVAPQVFYFKPHKKWYLFTQWPLKYSTASDISDPRNWATPIRLWPGNDNEAAALDYWVICDDASCYLYFFKDNGKMYFTKTPIDHFPNFKVENVREADIAGAGPQKIVFEGGSVYKLIGSNKYLLLVEGWESAENKRFYRSWESTSLDGPWESHLIGESSPFAGASNVDFLGDDWTVQVSNGELIRSGYDEKMEIDTCNLQFLYQGIDSNIVVGDFDYPPRSLGILKANN